MNLGKILRYAIILFFLATVAMPDGAEAARKRTKTTTATSQSSKKKQTKKSTTTSKKQTKKTTSAVSQSSGVTSTRRRRRNTGANSVTTATRDAAAKASAAGTSGSREQGKSSSGSSLTKIKVAKPDLNEVMETTLNPSNKYYFPKLWAKYQRNDTTMTPEEYRYLYLGYMFQEDYDPYRESIHAEKTESLRGKEKYTKEEVDTIRKYAEKALEDNPFDLRQMSFLVHVLKERNKNMSAKIWEYRLEHLLGAIKSTGTGEDVENAWFVIYPMHEYDMIQLLGYEAVDVEYIDPGYDHLIVQPDGSVSHRKPASGFYFNVVVPQQQYDLKHPENPS